MKKKIKFILLVTLFLVNSNYLFAQTCDDMGCVTDNYDDVEVAKGFTAYYNQIVSEATAWLGRNTSDLTGTYVGDSGYDGLVTYVFSNGVLVSRSCQNGRVNTFTLNRCTNGAKNPPTCNSCSSGSTWNGSSCSCNNKATDAPGCTICPAGLSMYNNLCVCANGATNPNACDVCPSAAKMDGGQCICPNKATPQSNCTECKVGDIMDGGVCKTACSMTNVCGEKKQGVIENGVCSPVSDMRGSFNNSCITTFTVSGTNVNPNGSVDFSWKILPLRTGVRSACGFVDLTTPTPRPIPGLQNLDPNRDKARISNIQSTTRFCLVCQFYNTSNNSSLGDAVAHQWIRVVRVGEQ